MKNNFLSKDTTMALRGLSAIMVVVSHIIDENYPKYIQGFRYGALWVSLFFLFSGFGLIYSYNSKKNYLQHFLLDKLVKLVIPFVITEVIYIVLNSLLFSSKYSIIELLLGIFGIKLINTSLWFVKNLCLFYLIFYFIYKSNAKKKTTIFISIIVIYMLIAIILDIIVGIDTWWYLSTPSFIIGLIIGNNYEFIKNKISSKKILLIMIFLTFCGIIIFYFLTKATINGYNSIINNNNYYIVLLELVLGPIFAIIFNYYFSLINIRLKFLTFIGKISMELYFYQRIIVNIVKTFLNINKPFLEIPIILLLSILAAIIMNKVNSIITTKIRRKYEN